MTEVDDLAQRVYQAWWDGDGHVCATYGCPDCLANARVAVSVVQDEGELL